MEAKTKKVSLVSISSRAAGLNSVAPCVCVCVCLRDDGGGRGGHRALRKPCRPLKVPQEVHTAWVQSGVGRYCKYRLGLRFPGQQTGDETTTTRFRVTNPGVPVTLVTSLLGGGGRTCSSFCTQRDNDPEHIDAFGEVRLKSDQKNNLRLVKKIIMCVHLLRNTEDGCCIFIIYIYFFIIIIYIYIIYIYI